MYNEQNLSESGRYLYEFVNNKENIYISFQRQVYQSCQLMFRGLNNTQHEQFHVKRPFGHMVDLNLLQFSVFPSSCSLKER